MYENIEPFWAAINLVNKKEMSKICSDGTIKKSIAELFNMQDTKKFTKLRECLDYLYKNYEFFRNNIDKKENIKENVLIDQLNQRIIKMFPTCVQKNSTMYNPMYYSMKKASHRVVNSLSKKIPQDFSSFKDFVYIVKKYDDNKYDKIRHQFDVSNFREKRFLNKIYLVKEFSEKRIETKFVDPNLFASDEVNIYGYLDSFYRNTPLFMVYFNKFTKEEDIKKASIALLNIIEQRKNIQIIYNFPQNYNSQYIKSLIEFFESQSLLKGKWVAIEGEINLPQFLSSADMILIPSDKNLQLENTVYTALKYGCIPVISSDGVCDDIVIDIFDDMNSGCGFKVEKSDNDTNEDAVEYERALYTENLERALNFYENSAASWNILIKNAINCDRSWDFSTIESYNNVYDDII